MQLWQSFSMMDASLKIQHYITPVLKTCCCLESQNKKKTKYTKYTKDKNQCISTHLSGTYQWLSPTQSLLVPWQFQGPEETPSHFPNDSSKVATSQQTLQKHKTIFNKTISLGKWLIPVQPNISMHILYMVCNTLQ